MAVKTMNLTQEDMTKLLRDKGEITDEMTRAMLNGTMDFNFSARLVGAEGKKEVIVDFNYWEVVTVTTD
jgi:hypothetical protein